ncbi:hypothetical protein [Streptomyces xanthophaeus]|uniref:hypothetical protein n=1 Tax=Streptomyces xanthophaeus TaxID=67385 RepID=UPI003710CF78
MDADTRLADIRAREQAATKGPWERCPEYGEHFYAYLGGSHLLGVGDINFGDGKDAEADLAFTLAARADIPWLLDTIAELRAQVQELTAENRGYERALGLNEAA